MVAVWATVRSAGTASHGPVESTMVRSLPHKVEDEVVVNQVAAPHAIVELHVHTCLVRRH